MTDDDPSTVPMPIADFDARVAGIASLAEPLRRDLYRFVISQSGPVNRDQAAQGAGVARHIAKFHLDKLVDEGLLAIEFARPDGRRGPGAGRPAKLYRRSSRELAVSLPQREYELVGRLLATAVTDAARDGVSVGVAVGHAARAAGVALGARAREAVGPRPAAKTLRAAAVSALGDVGYEPREVDSGIALINCPFHALAQDYKDLVCGMNLELIHGLVDGLGVQDLEARLEPTPGQCCVRLRRQHATLTKARRSSQG